MLAYVGYSYAYYLFGIPFSDLLLLHAAVFSSSLFALVLTGWVGAQRLRFPTPWSRAR